MKTRKNHPQKVAYAFKQKFRCFRNFSLTAHSASQQPKWQNSCSKMWSIEQLYLELGSKSYEVVNEEKPLVNRNILNNEMCPGSNKQA